MAGSGHECRQKSLRHRNAQTDDQDNDKTSNNNHIINNNADKTNIVTDL